MSGLVNKRGEGLTSTAIETGKFIGDVAGIRSTQEQARESLNLPYDTQFQDVGENFEAKAELKTLKDKESKQGLSKDEAKRKESLEQYTNVRSFGQQIIDGTGNLTGQVLFQALATKGLSAGVSGAVKATGLLRTEQIISGLATEEMIAAQATDFGISRNLITAMSANAIAFGSSYDAAMREARDAMMKKDTACAEMMDKGAMGKDGMMKDGGASAPMKK